MEPPLIAAKTGIVRTHLLLLFKRRWRIKFSMILLNPVQDSIRTNLRFYDEVTYLLESFMIARGFVHHRCDCLHPDICRTTAVGLEKGLGVDE